MNIEIKCENCTYRDNCENAYDAVPNATFCGIDFGFALDHELLKLKTMKTIGKNGLTN